MSSDTATIVRDLLKAKKLTQAQMAEELGVDQSTVNRWLKGANMRPHLYDQLLVVARKAGVRSRRRVDSTQADLLTFQQEVPLRGYIGAGAAVLKVAHDSVTDELEHVLVPEVFGDVTALKVRGDSMYPAYKDGDILLFGEFDGRPEELIGRECLVITSDDLWLLKTIERGSRANRFHLLSHNSTPQRDVKIKEAKPVKYVMKA